MRRINVGDKLYFVAREARSSCLNREVTVLKVGRKWAELDNRHRIDLNDWCADGGQYSSPGRCYESKDEYDGEVRRNRRWEKIRLCVSNQWGAPANMTDDGLNAIEKLLGIVDDQKKGG